MIQLFKVGDNIRCTCHEECTFGGIIERIALPGDTEYFTTDDQICNYVIVDGGCVTHDLAELVEPPKKTVKNEPRLD